MIYINILLTKQQINQEKKVLTRDNLINEDVNQPMFVDYHKYPNQMMMK